MGFMNSRKIMVIGAGVVLMGALSWLPSGAAPGANAETAVAAHKKAVSPRPAAAKAVRPKTSLAVEAQAAPTMPSSGITLVPPPVEIPRTSSHAMVTSVTPVAIPIDVAPKAPRAVATNVPSDFKNAPSVVTAATRKETASKPAVAAGNNPAAAPRTAAHTPATAMSRASKPAVLFSYVRMLNFSPHPQEEEFLRDKPLALNGKNYHFSVRYHEDWTVLGDEEGDLKGISFEIDILENGTKVRSLKTPKVSLSNKSLKKGQVLGVADVAPYRFVITVDDYLVNKKFINELTFKLDLLG
jgi:hypothetical protein